MDPNEYYKQKGEALIQSRLAKTIAHNENVVIPLIEAEAKAKQEENDRILSEAQYDTPIKLLTSERDVNKSMNMVVLSFLSELFIDSLVIDESLIVAHSEKFKDYFINEIINTGNYDINVPLCEQFTHAHPFVQILSEEMIKPTIQRKGMLNDIKNHKCKQDEKLELVDRALVMTTEEAERRLKNKVRNLEPEIGPNMIRTTIIDYIKNENEANKIESRKIMEIKKQVKEIIESDTTPEKTKVELTENWEPKELNKLRIASTTQFGSELLILSESLIIDSDKEYSNLSESVYFDEKGTFLVEHALTEMIIIQTVKEMKSLYML